MRCLNQQNLYGTGAQVNMNGLSLLSPSSINTFKADQSKGKKMPQPDYLHSTKSLPTGRFYGSKVHGQSRKMACTNKLTRSNALSAYSYGQNSVALGDSFDLISKGCNAITSSDASKIQKAVKRGTKRKTRREKKNNKILTHVGSANSQGLSNIAHGSLTSESCTCNDHEDELISGSTSPELSLSDGSISKIDYDGSTIGINSSLARRPCLSNINEVAIVGNITGSMFRSFPVECCATISEAGIRTNYQGGSALDGGMKETNHTQMQGFHHSKDSSDGPDSLVLDSVSVIPNSDNSNEIGNDVKPVNIGCNLSESSDFLSQKGPFPKKYLVNGVAETSGHSEFRNCGTQVSSNGDVKSLVPVKRGKQIKTLPNSSCLFESVDTGKLQGRAGKENRRAVWQKVQRTHVGKFRCEQKKCPIQTQFKTRLKEVPPAEKNDNLVEANAISRNEIKEEPKEDMSTKSRRKGNRCLKHDCYSKRKYQPSKSCLSAHTITSRQHNEMPHVPAPVNDKGAKCVSGSQFQNECQRARLQSSRVACLNSESSLQVVADASEPQETSCGTLCNIENDYKVIQYSSLSKSSDTRDQNLLKVPSPYHLCHVYDEVPQIEKETTLVEYNKQNHTCGSVSQKWIPVLSKYPGLTESEKIKSSSEDQIDSAAGGDWALRNAFEETVDSTQQHLVSSSTYDKDLSSGNEEEWIKHTIPSLEQDDKQVAASSSSSESNGQYVSAIEAESSKIIQAVNDAYRLQVESEAVGMTTGCPIAEFERILHFSSPVICESPSTFCCQNCMQNQVVGMSPCRHKTPDVKLGCLWHWYEKHGSYGLEVRAEDYEKPKRLGVDRFAFRAYFVPFLSAIQLFGNHRGQSTKNGNEISATEVSEKCQISKASEKSDVGCHSTFCVSEPLTAAAGQSVEMAWSDDQELLFEYFESDQPQQRCPLYEKIQELVRGDGSSPSKIFGDPTTLVSLSLHDLHPMSWYSVAWYPIYKIPDGKFRAAFLTYHSLGHLVRTSAQFDSSSIDACVVSPVVGLQSYNAQGECWFRLRHGEAGTTLNPSEILKERLRTLEVTASLMARAMVYKGDKKSANKHPDYEFFLSRQRY